MATIAMKYIVASATIVRTNPESLSILLSRIVYQTITRNADSSGCPHSQQSSAFYTSDWSERNHVPNTTPTVFGIDMNRRLTTITHRLKASTGNE